MAIEISRRPTWGQFVAWAICGVSALSILGGVFTPLSPLGALVTAVSLVAALLLGGANVSSVGALAGVGAWPLAYASFGSGLASVVLAVVGLGFVAAAVVVFCTVRRRMSGTVSG